MDFKQICIEDKMVIEKYLRSDNQGIAEHCFTSIFMWQDFYSTAYCVDEEFLYIKSKSSDKKEDYYMYPVGKGDIKVALNKLFDSFGDDITIVSITEEQKQVIETLMPNVFNFTEQRNSADYIYLSERLISLSGKKLHAKRNFVNRFISTNEGNYSFEEIRSENKYKAWEFHLTWSKDSENEEQAASLFAEKTAIKKIIDNFESLGAVGALLSVGGKVIGFTIATKSTEDLAVVQIEKCNIEYEGAYQTINKLFVENLLSDMTYINREEDLGIEGLRKAKMSYRPEIIRTKYSAVKKI